ncbi:uncharacterized protein Z520_04419 [Fonsecaea multimorphosa CBS 102226]|uniref:Transcription factor IIIC putative zinc-finger domain-containing protein n=1 Tax=Fonsecaea multimorphosa CBS 102226 TaxID=1442371 RepID=A0A0D2KSS9_9EURO|nr:uncharacterized protein Z520_04419 [Fonsecaea multimorphosa CBS 102226]KIX99783.1 hypothetical protein Z520_04419 [Fonsecaea multimorphosa CBS 102226]OAL26571.1 hypothetical protein AYO22_04182 [Fonsecaea multimorphosa]
METLKGNLEPVTLSYWPTCKNALTWSPEDLAVAAGELVHILTPRDASRSLGDPGHKQWHTFTLRVNQFESSEWPLQQLATITQFSIGEELSESTVVSLSWSPSGLGIYRRSVLAILTSNLILSLWESNGRLGVWQRTAIVNQYLPRVEAADSSRRKQRVRAFHWLPALSLSAGSRWGSQLLAVADDDFTVLFFRLWKTNLTAYGDWSCKLLAQYKIPDLKHLDARAMKRLGLRTILAQSSPISSLETGKWRFMAEPSKHSGSAAVDLKVSFGQCSEAKYLSVQVNWMDEGNDNNRHEMELSITPLRSESSFFPLEMPTQSQFDSAIQKARSDFDRSFGLGGRIRVNYWGTEFSPDQTIAAACISLHPSDMIEYGAPSAQRTTVVFARMHEPLVSEITQKAPSEVQKGILEFVRDSPLDLVKTDLDKHIVRTAAALIKLHFNSVSPLTHWADDVLNLLPTNVSGQVHQHIDQRAAHNHTGPMAAAESGGENTVLADEVCELCGDIIPFSADPSQAKCNRGHQFTRCSLSFVAVQEPGISVYCSKCGRQFLDPGKLERADGPSLSQALFDHFDVCPYCQGKFRG